MSYPRARVQNDFLDFEPFVDSATTGHTSTLDFLSFFLRRTIMASSTNIKVVCRFRPQNALELREGGDIVVAFDENLQTVQMKNSQAVSGPEKDGFTFDRVFLMGTKQHKVFDYGVKDIVKDVLDGYNGTVFAYGQTGSGKTFSMMGADIDSSDLKGIIPRITEQIFKSIVESNSHLEYVVKVSYLEIYLERIHDLLARM
ncbi:P-loop containing nucleoside triphosphate hydrolase protein [Suillus subalutaceus]|uniref:P-loop containing nucleoside triphosphate hydrolase protein n=1 Tax=Suillus subalutaceus TaxID=48586 RepID=UPI001B872DCC|nr:P-loop containing nucleoside triphosphate hydrolase protein [Suillus subalutaceus]KAG1847154.1 P-loop containing nucleoside triphosphate hydrolase protein [Suillus subalutaceus]